MPSNSQTSRRTTNLNQQIINDVPDYLFGVFSVWIVLGVLLLVVPVGVVSIVCF